MKKYVPELWNAYPSFYYYEIQDSLGWEDNHKTILLTSEFDDGCGPVTPEDCGEYDWTMDRCNWDETCTLLAMLGIRSLLRNEHEERCVPYQIQVSPDLGLGDIHCWHSLVDRLK